MSRTTDRKRDFVLVHGAWAGGWGMQRLADRLVAAGHRAFVPTLSGLGERSHLADRGIDLSTHIADVANEIAVKDLHDVVLVGASYAGLVITGAAETIGDRLSALVYLDAFIPEDGQSFADITGMEISGAMIEVPDFGPSAELSDEENPWIATRVTAQPAGTMTEKIRLTEAAERVKTRLYVQATGWNTFSGLADKLRKDPSWIVRSIDCGHDIAFLRPDDLTDILLADALT